MAFHDLQIKFRTRIALDCSSRLGQRFSAGEIQFAALRLPSLLTLPSALMSGVWLRRSSRPRWPRF